MKIKEALARFREAAEPVCRENGLSVWDLTFEKEGPDNVLTLFIDCPEGVDIDRCEKVSRALDPVLDLPEYAGFPPYTFSVSSPGLERRLCREEHYEWAKGKKVTAALFKDEGEGKQITGIFERTAEGFLINGRLYTEKQVSSLRICYDF